MAADLTSTNKYVPPELYGGAPGASVDPPLVAAEVEYASRTLDAKIRRTYAEDAVPPGLVPVTILLASRLRERLRASSPSELRPLFADLEEQLQPYILYDDDLVTPTPASFASMPDTPSQFSEGEWLRSGASAAEWAALPEATAEQAGTMSPAQVTKLDGIEEGATAGGGGGGGQTAEQVQQAIRTAPDVVELREQAAATRHESTLVSGASITVASGNQPYRFPQPRPQVPADEVDRELVVSVDAPAATRRFELSALTDKDVVDDFTALSTANAVVFASDDGQRNYYIARRADGEFWFSADSSGTFVVTIVDSRLALEDFANRNHPNAQVTRGRLPLSSSTEVGAITPDQHERIENAIDGSSLADAPDHTADTLADDDEFLIHDASVQTGSQLAEVRVDQVKELIRDVIAAALTDGDNIAITADDAANTITVATSGIEAGATADQTPTEIVAGLEGLGGSDRLDYSALDNAPTIPDALTGADVVALLTALAGNARLPATAIRDLAAASPHATLRVLHSGSATGINLASFGSDHRQSPSTVRTPAFDLDDHTAGVLFVTAQAHVATRSNNAGFDASGERDAVFSATIPLSSLRASTAYDVNAVNGVLVATHDWYTGGALAGEVSLYLSRNANNEVDFWTYYDAGSGGTGNATIQYTRLDIEFIESDTGAAAAKPAATFTPSLASTAANDTGAVGAVTAATIALAGAAQNGYSVANGQITVPAPGVYHIEGSFEFEATRTTNFTGGSRYYPRITTQLVTGGVAADVAWSAQQEYATKAGQTATAQGPNPTPIHYATTIDVAAGQTIQLEAAGHSREVSAYQINAVTDSLRIRQV